MEFRRSFPLPVRLYRGSTYMLWSAPKVSTEQPVIYDHEGYPVRWVNTPPKPKQQIGFNPQRIRDDGPLSPR